MSKRILILLLIISSVILTFCTKKSTSPEEQLLPPTNLTISLVENNKIQINWIDNSTNETAYFIDRKMATYNWLENFGEVVANIMSFTDNIPTNSDTVFSYRIRAFNDENYSAYSDTIAWFSNNAAPSNLQIEQVAQDTLQLTWQDNSIGEQYFRIDRRIDEKGWQMDYAHVPADSTHFLDYTTALYDTCNYKVFAVTGISHSDSTENAFIPFLPAPSNLELQALGATEVTLTWQDNCHNEDGYRVFFKRGEIALWDSLNLPENTEEYTDENVIPGIMNYYKICAYIVDDHSGYIEDSLNTLPAPTNLQIEQLNVHTFKLDWEDNSIFEQGFKIDRKIDDEEWINEIGNVDPNITTWTDSTVGRNYEVVYFRVYAYYGEYNSNKILKRFGIFAPTNLTLQKPDNDKIKISWEDNSYGEEGFIIDKKIGNLDWVTNYATVDSNTVSYIDNITEPCGTFYYRVMAFYNGFYSDYSNEEHINIRLEEVGSVNTSGDAIEVFVANWKAFVADYYNGLIIIDCSNPSAPNEITTMNLPDRTLSVFVHENLAYVTNYIGRLNIVDVSSLEIIDSCSTAGVPNDIFVSGGFAYIAEGESGLSILILSGTPHLITTCETNGDARKVFIRDNYAFVANGLNGGIAIIDVSNPSNPNLVSNLPITGLAQDVYVIGNYAYLADGENGLEVIDISDVNSPILTANCPTDGFAYSVYVRDNYVYLADEEKGLFVIDVLDPLVPYILGTFEMSTEPISIYLSGSYAFLVDNEGLKIVQISP